MALEGDVSEGLLYRLGEVRFVKNHAFSGEELRQQFPLTTHDIFVRSKIARGLESLRNLYGTRGYVDFVAIPNTQLGSAGIANLTIEVEEGAQYHMGKLEIVAEKETEARLRAKWKLAEGAVYDRAYIDEYLASASDILPSSFSRANVETALHCPEASVHIRLMVDPTQDTPNSHAKTILCKEPAKDH